MQASEKYGLYENYVEWLLDDESPRDNSLTSIVQNLGEGKFLSLQEVTEEWRELEEGLYGLYIHVPYCIKRCTYCNLSASVLQDKEEINDYINRIIKLINHYGEKIDLEFKYLYIGGGTPSILNERDLESLIKAINKNFDFSEENERSIEMSPTTATKEKIDIVREKGLNRLSFGIQSTDRKVLKQVNRGYQSWEDAEKMIEYSLQKDFKEVNADLLVGLKGSEERDLLKSFEQLAMTGVDRICLYTLEPTDRYMDIAEESAQAIQDKVSRTIENIEEELLDIAEKQGYELARDLDELENYGEATAFSFTRNSHSGFRYGGYAFKNPRQDGVLGIGFKSSSRIGDKLRYTQERQLKSLEPKEKPFFGFKFNEREIKANYIVDRFGERGKVDLSDYNEKFGTSLKNDFEEALKDLKELELVTIENSFLELNGGDRKECLVAAMMFSEHEKIAENMVERMPLEEISLS